MAGNAGGNNMTTADDNDIYQSLDPLDPRKVSLEIFELYCHEMITAPIVGRRAYLITKMRVSGWWWWLVLKYIYMAAPADLILITDIVLVSLEHII